MKTLGALLALTILAAGCAAPVEEADLAVASYPAAFVAENLAGDDLTVAQLGAGSGLHDFEPSARDIDQLRSTTHLILWDGGYEDWVRRVETSLGRSAPNVVELRALPAGEALLESEEGEEDAGRDGDGHGHDELEHDPHTWNDPLAMRASVHLLEDHLAQAYPSRAEGIRARAATLDDRLQALHEAFEEGLADCANDTIITNHEAHNYLARRYGFELFALHGIEPGSEPSPKTVHAAIQRIKDLGLPVVFVEEGTDPGVLKAIKDETDVQIRVLATNEGRPATGDYVDAQHRNLEELRMALDCT